MLLYKKDSKNKIRQLEIYSKGDVLYQVSGIVGGKQVTHEKVCKPKNVGKSNETTGEEQASKQAESLVTKKLREGYFDNEIDAKLSVSKLPMLAKDYFKFKHKLKDLNKLIVQPKLDGVRCNIHYDAKNGTIKALSRKNFVLENIDHILDEIKCFMTNYYPEVDNIIFDGELYLHGRTFQEVTKLIKNKPNKNELIEYHIYDIMDEHKPFTDRNLLMADYSNNNLLEHTIFVESREINNNAIDLETAYAEYVEAGYEGMMVRVPDSLYKINGRSFDLLKYKKFIDIALPIVDITPNDANPEHGTVWVEFKGKLQKTGSKLSHADRKTLLEERDNLIGQMAEIRYFEETDEGRMRFPYYHGIRIDK